jgi:predicted esterase YcpF (UPF0227 family)
MGWPQGVARRERAGPRRAGIPNASREGRRLSGLIYLHGFNSAPQSHKAQVLWRYMEDRGLGDRYACPKLPPAPQAAVAVIEDVLARLPGATLIGSSLGGFYATHLAEAHRLQAVLINPAVTPQADLESYLGPQRNLYTGEEYELTRDHLAQWRALAVERVDPARYLLLVETGDEVLDYRHAVTRYRGADQVVIEGGDHSLRSFPAHLDRILAFAGLAPARTI